MNARSDRYATEDALRNLLVSRMREKREELHALLAKFEHHWGVEDAVYRFYHQSFKIYHAQALTQEAVVLLQSLLPERPLNAWFLLIVRDGTGKEFETSHNEDWLRHTRPIVEALFHATYFLRMACKYADELQRQPSPLPSGFAALLYLFDLR